MENVRAELIERLHSIHGRGLTLADHRKALERADGLVHLIGWTEDHPSATAAEYQAEQERVKRDGPPDLPEARHIPEEDEAVDIKRAWMEGPRMMVEMKVGGELYVSEMKRVGVGDCHGHVYTQEALERACEQINEGGVYPAEARAATV